jgi:hypothetical protein
MTSGEEGWVLLLLLLCTLLGEEGMRTLLLLPLLLLPPLKSLPSRGNDVPEPAEGDEDNPDAVRPPEEEEEGEELTGKLLCAVFWNTDPPCPTAPAVLRPRPELPGRMSTLPLPPVLFPTPPLSGLPAAEGEGGCAVRPSPAPAEPAPAGFEAISLLLDIALQQKGAACVRAVLVAAI